MFGISSMELLVILLVAVVAVGPEKMPSIIRTLAKMLAEFRRLRTDFHRLMNLELANLEAQKAPRPEAPPNPGPKPAQPAEQGASIEESAPALDSTEPDARPQSLPETSPEPGAQPQQDLSGAPVQAESVADKEGRDER